jgi:hypothetical protein
MVAQAHDGPAFVFPRGRALAAITQSQRREHPQMLHSATFIKLAA